LRGNGGGKVGLRLEIRDDVAARGVKVRHGHDRPRGSISVVGFHITVANIRNVHRNIIAVHIRHANLGIVRDQVSRKCAERIVLDLKGPVYVGDDHIGISQEDAAGSKRAVVTLEAHIFVMYRLL